MQDRSTVVPAKTCLLPPRATASNSMAPCRFAWMSFYPFLTITPSYLHLLPVAFQLLLFNKLCSLQPFPSFSSPGSTPPVRSRQTTHSTPTALSILRSSKPFCKLLRPPEELVEASTQPLPCILTPRPGLCIGAAEQRSSKGQSHSSI